MRCTYCGGTIDTGPAARAGAPGHTYHTECLRFVVEEVMPERMDRVALVRLAKQRHLNIRRLLKNQDPKIVEVGEYMQSRIEAALA